MAEEDVEEELDVAEALGIKAPVPKPPQDGPVRLPIGFNRYQGGTPVAVKEAWVQELTGEAEEAVSSARAKNDYAATIDAILRHGVKTLGGIAPTQEEIRGLFLADREYLLLEISRATYGDEMEYENLICPNCQELFSVSFNKSEDIQTTAFQDISQANFSVDLRNGRVAYVQLPDGNDQAETLKGTTPAQINTILLSRTVMAVVNKGEDRENSLPITVDFVRKLGIVDRETILTALADHAPGPQYNVSVTHSCGNEVKVAVTFGDLFRGL